MSESLVARARRYIRLESQGTDEGWLGIAPSYFCTKFDIDYDDACALLLKLEEEGFIYDNRNGNYHKLEDGRQCATRFFLRRSLSTANRTAEI